MIHESYFLAAPLSTFFTSSTVFLTKTPRFTQNRSLDRGRRFEIEIAPVAATDTLRAGDVLHGAFCHHFARSREFERALRWASQIATLSCQSLGTEAWANQPGIPSVN
ncbi:MAG: PfkB family carbohydrate kinase [Terracidiphilus sp.]|jgi:sugar/nucleoside kinase (ribokinase family)